MHPNTGPTFIALDHSNTPFDISRLSQCQSISFILEISGPVYTREGPCTRGTDTDENIEESLKTYVRKQICLCGILKNSSDVINDVCIRLCASNLLEADVCIWYRKRELFKYFKETDMGGLEEVHWLLFGREGWITRDTVLKMTGPIYKSNSLVSWEETQSNIDCVKEQLSDMVKAAVELNGIFKVISVEVDVEKSTSYGDRESCGTFTLVLQGMQVIARLTLNELYAHLREELAQFGLKQHMQSKYTFIGVDPLQPCTQPTECAQM
ncbi:uncharacterized protein DEA37_0000919 [Paragonimus westermani]|uniref:Uncharacterized protein n=1 Tax=Paragonimus westermani TaxID=34504 RepID=A0A5J4NYY7_9TREM|nr:uncharacterized protein DEA37_0000919 [Paragonimus westermani]